MLGSRNLTKIGISILGLTPLISKAQFSSKIALVDQFCILHSKQTELYNLHLNTVGSFLLSSSSLFQELL
jgi:hypothetical protein